MREATGTTFSFQVMILFLLIFSAFLIIVINYSRAYMVKNDMLSVIEKYEGVYDESRDIMNNYILSKGYKGNGKCPEGWYGVYDLENDYYEESVRNKKYYYCYKEKDENEKYYTEIKVFFKFDLPIIGNIMTYGVNGKTNVYKGYNK